MRGRSDPTQVARPERSLIVLCEIRAIQPGQDATWCPRLLTVLWCAPLSLCVHVCSHIDFQERLTREDLALWADNARPLDKSISQHGDLEKVSHVTIGPLFWNMAVGGCKASVPLVVLRQWADRLEALWETDGENIGDIWRAIRRYSGKGGGTNREPEKRME